MDVGWVDQQNKSNRFYNLKDKDKIQTQSPPQNLKTILKVKGKLTPIVFSKQEMKAPVMTLMTQINLDTIKFIEKRTFHDI